MEFFSTEFLSIYLPAAYTLFGAVLSALLGSAWVDRPGKNTKRARVKMIRGKWMGSFTQTAGSKPAIREYKGFCLTLRTTLFCGIRGSAEYQFSLPEEGEIIVKLLVWGRFLDSNTVALRYRQDDSKKIQYGWSLLDLDQFGNVLSGQFMGVGHLSRAPTFAAGQLNLDHEKFSKSQ